MCLLYSQANAAVDPVKMAKKLAGWVLVAQQYTQAMNKVLSTHVSKRKSAFEQMLTSLTPAKAVLEHMDMSDYLDGTLVVWRNKQNVFGVSKTDPQSLTCSCCGTSHRFSRLDRVLFHLMSKKHHAKCKEQLDSAVQARSQNLLDEHCKSVSSNCNLHISCMISDEFSNDD